MVRGLRRGHQSGFTLIELMIVIAIIGILAAILTPIFMRARFKTYHTACVQNERNIATALELYSLENESLYPTALTELVTGATPYIAYISECPSVAIDYAGSYTVSSDQRSYVIECPGIHELQLPGIVLDTYPRASDGAVEQYRPGS